MKKLKNYFALLATTATFSLFGWQMDCCPDTCCPVECDGDWFLEADWIYAKTNQEGLDFAQLVEPVTIDATTSTVTYTNLKFKDRWESGFRVRGAYKLPCYGWDLGISYTYIPGKAKLNRSIADATIGAFIVPTAPEIFFIELITSGDAAFSSVAAEWKSKLNYLDVDVSNRFTMCNNVVIAPRFGLRFLWLKEDLFIDTIGIVGTTGDLFPSFAFRQHEKFRSVGIMVGLKGCWDVGCGLSIVGDASGSLLYGRFRTRNSAFAATPVIESTGPIVDVTTFNNKETERRIVPTFDYTLGLRYANCMCDINYFIRVDWFEQILIDVNQFGRYGNLSSQGLVLGGGFSF